MHDNNLFESTRNDAICGRMEHVEGDRLSSLPDDLIHKILSFICIKEAIRTSVLSSRWRFIWTSMPYLNFSSVDFSVSSDFFANVLSRRDNQVHVSSVKFVYGEFYDDEFIREIVNYVVSHNVQQLTIESFFWSCYFGYHVPLFRSKFLKHLTLVGITFYHHFRPSATWELPALTTLHLHRIRLSDASHIDKYLFSKCTNLKNLTLSKCEILGTKVFNIFHPRLSNLTLEDICDMDIVNVVTPQLQNLTIRYCHGKHLISASGVTSLVMRGYHPLQLCTQGFPYLEMAELFIDELYVVEAHKIVCLLQQLHNVKILKLNFEILKLFSSYTGIISHQPSLSLNLKILNFLPMHMGAVCLELPAQEKVTMSYEIKNQDTSPSAIFPMVSSEEIEIMRYMLSAQELIEEVRVLVKMCEANSHHMTNRRKKKGKLQVTKQWVQSEFEMQWHFWEMMDQIEQGKLEGLLTKQLPIIETCYMISWLECIEGLVSELPESKRTAMQATFSSLCEKAANLMSKMIDGMNKPMIIRSSSAKKWKPKKNRDPSFIYWP